MSDLYKQSGVSIDDGNAVVANIKDVVAKTHSSSVLVGIGSFGALYDLSEVLKKYKNPVLVQSVDGVGTKLMVAKMANDYSKVGADIVNHSANDIVCMGAEPLTFLDYVAHEKLEKDVMNEIIRGMADACVEGKISLIGGETAEMPGVYVKGEHDIAGAITGVVEREKIITGEKIEVGDAVIGLSSSGLHTNGYSLARKAFFDIGKFGVNDTPEGLDGTVGEVLLRAHLNYSPAVLVLALALVTSSSKNFFDQYEA